MPSPSPGRAAAQPSPAPDAGQDPHAVPGFGLDARYEQLRHAALHARAEAFPLGFAVLTRQGVTAWNRALTQAAPTPNATRPVATTAPDVATLPGPVAAELVNALAAVVLAGT